MNNMRKTLLPSKTTPLAGASDGNSESMRVRGAPHLHGGPLANEVPTSYRWAIDTQESWWTPVRSERSRNMRRWQLIWSKLPPLRQHQLEVFVNKLRALGSTECGIDCAVRAAVDSDVRYASDAVIARILNRRHRKVNK